MFVDRAVVNIRGGVGGSGAEAFAQHGGDGAVHKWRRVQYPGARAAQQVRDFIDAVISRLQALSVGKQ